MDKTKENVGVVVEEKNLEQNNIEENGVKEDSVKEVLNARQIKKQQKKLKRQEKLEAKRKREAASDEKWMDILRKVDKKYYPLIAAFFTGMAAYYILFLARGQYAIATSDLWGQYYDFMRAFRRTVYEGGSIFYNWTLGPGAGTIGSVAYFLLSPFNVIVLIMPESQTLLAMCIIIVLKLMAASLTFGIFARKVLKRQGMEVIIFSFAYGLCGFCLSYYYIYMWLDAVILFPVICIMMKRLIRENKWIGLVVSLTVLFITNFYMGYMTGVVCFFVFCGMYYYWNKGKKKTFRQKAVPFLKCFGKFVGCAIIAALMCMVVILPAVIQLSDRLEGNDIFDVNFKNFLNADPLTLYRQLFPNFYEILDTGEIMYYCGTLTAFLIPLFFFSKKIKKREKRVYAGLLVIMALIIMIAPLNRIMYAGTENRYYNFRYAFLISGIFVAMGCRLFPYLTKAKPAVVMKLLLFNSVYLVLYFVLVKILYHYKDFTFNLDFLANKETYMGSQDNLALCFCVGCVLITGLVIFFGLKKKMPPRQLSLVLFLILFLEIVIDGTVLWNTRKQLYTDTECWEVNAKKVSDQLLKEELDKLPQEDFYRVEKNWVMTENDNVGVGMRGLRSFTSTDNSGWYTYMAMLGMVSLKGCGTYNGATEIAKSLLNVRYILHENDEIYFTESYEDLDKNAFYVEENDTWLPLGFMVSEKIQDLNSKDNEDVNPFETQEEILSAMLGGEKVKCYKKVEAEEPHILFMENNEVDGMEDIEGIHFYKLVEDSTIGLMKYKVNKSYGDGIYYGYMYSYPVVSPGGSQANRVRFYGSGEGERYKEQVNYINNAYCYDSFVVNLTGEQERINWDEIGYIQGSGEIDHDNLEYDVFFAGSEYVTIGDPYFYYYDEESFRTIAERLKENPLVIEEYDDTHIRGTITAKDNQIMYTSIPYESSWTAYVDGKKQEITPIMYGSSIGLALSAGQHEIELVYEPEGLQTGIYLSLIGVVLFVLCTGVEVYRCRKNKTA